MTRSEFFNKLNENATDIQSVAADLTNNREEAHKLYLETIFQAIKNLGGVRFHKGFRPWLVITMRNVFWNQFRQAA